MTTRERVLRWHRRGKSASWIADKIGISTQAVYHHLHRLEADGEITNAVRRYQPRGKK